MNITVFEGTVRHELPFVQGETILTVLQNAGIQSITAPCGGKGSCKKCEVFVRSAEFTGPCLSCTTPAAEGMTVEIIPEVRFSFADRSDGDIWPPTPGQSGYAIACDIGTTTVVCQLLKPETGELLSRVSGSNAQRVFGGDVLSRLKAAEEGRAAEIHDQIIQQINFYIEELCRKEGLTTGDIKSLTAAGNTIMMHFFAGIDPSQISTAPFTPVTLFGETLRSRDLGLVFDGSVYICPAVSGFIGGDVPCGVLASGMAASEGKMLLVDLGANTEIVMGGRDRMLACAVDGGAAFKASLLENGIPLSGLDKLLLGGGFGFFAHRRNSALLGIIPQQCKGKTVKLGNAALAGAISAAWSEDARKELSRIQKLLQVIDLPTHPSFSDAYMDGMVFE